MTWLNASFKSPHDFILVNRLYSAFASLNALRDPSALPGVVSSHAESDEIQSDESYAFPSMLLFLIPILGFIGTVIGLSQSIGGFGAALSQNTEDITNLIASLQNVTGGLSVAFDTTLFALLCALLLQLYFSMIRSKESHFYEDCTGFFQKSFFPNIIHPSQQTSSQKDDDAKKKPTEG
jgi:biopolymer transport protein ExbB/TolQ